ncbi:hypothetical protein IAQ61_008209 [Plenodomus lingam]|uniref:uncharacterized protein n=1 Tax=Leptosphaeria maculans TaxID=5022 RepID=UPI0033262AAB|nr:hypothetical protein IAQ61_008209 [Plenodomus lingam]
MSGSKSRNVRRVEQADKANQILRFSKAGVGEKARRRADGVRAPLPSPHAGCSQAKEGEEERSRSSTLVGEDEEEEEEEEEEDGSKVLWW